MSDESKKNIELSGRILELDGVRGVAIILVLLWHYVACQMGPLTNGGTLYWLHRVISLSWSGVDLFFVLSGFFVAGILLDNRESRGCLRAFYVRRACRLLPLYVLLLLSFLVVANSGWMEQHGIWRFRWLTSKPMPMWSYATFTQNIVMGLRDSFGAQWLGVTWALAVEVQFYLFFPFIVVFFSRRALTVCLFLLLLSAPALRTWMPAMAAFTNIMTRWDSLAAGALIAVALRDSRIAAALPRFRTSISVLLVVACAGVAAIIWRPQCMGVLAHSWLAFLYASLILVVLTNREGVLGALARSRILVFLGRISYGLFLVHQIVSGCLHGIFRSGARPSVMSLEGAILTACSAIVAVVIAALSFKYVESRFLSLGHRFSYRPTRAVAGDGA